MYHGRPSILKSGKRWKNKQAHRRRLKKFAGGNNMRFTTERLQFKYPKRGVENK
jgi:hypothetical protein